MRLRPVCAALGGLVAGVLALTGCQPAGTTAGAAPAPPAPHAATTPAAPTAPAARPPHRYYLALGDSLGFGFQQARLDREQAAGDYDPATFRGYNASLARRLAAAQQATVTTVNLACPGETTATFARGGCPFHGRLHATYAGPQQAAALRFLAAHRGATALITLSLGANDLLALEGGCGLRLACVDARLPSVTATVTARVAAAVRRLRTADPPARVVVLAPYNPLGTLLPATNARLARFDQALTTAVRRAGGEVADAFAAFNTGGPQPATLCRLSAFCAPGQDVHPTDAGYAVLARLLWGAAGIGR